MCAGQLSVAMTKYPRKSVLKGKTSDLRSFRSLSLGSIVCGPMVEAERPAGDCGGGELVTCRENREEGSLT